MAISGKTSKFEIPYFLGTDKPPDMAAVTKAAAERLEAVFPVGGLVGSAGTIVAGTGFTVSRVEKGKYSITLSTERSLNLSPVVSSGHINYFASIEGSPTKKQFTVIIEDTAGAKADQDFNFIVL